VGGVFGGVSAKEDEEEAAAYCVFLNLRCSMKYLVKYLSSKEFLFAAQFSLQLLTYTHA